MRRQKPLPKESSFKEFANNRSSKTKTKTRSKKPRFQIKDEKDDKYNRRSDEKKSYSRDNNRRSSGRDDKRGQRGDRRTSSSRGTVPRSRNNDRRNSSKSVKYDRRDQRGKSFKENNRDSRRLWDKVAPNMRGVERRSRGKNKVEMFDAICKKCGKPCKVPFKPTMSKGVSCRDCFDRNSRDNYKKSNGFREKRESFSGRNSQKFARIDGGVKELFDAVCMKCHKPCKVPFKPTGKMGVSCSNCFVKNESPGRGKKTGGRSSFSRGRPSVRSRR